MIPFIRTLIPRRYKPSICLLLISLLGANLQATGFRAVDSYLDDPLTESWRWQRVEGLEGSDMAIVKAAPNDKLGIISGPNRIYVYDGYRLNPVNPPSDIELNEVNALGVTANGVFCLVTMEGIFLVEGDEWTRVSEGSLSRRGFDAVMETPDGIIWAATDDGLARIDPVTKTCRILPTPGQVLSICEGPGKTSLWISTEPRGNVWEAPLKNGELDMTNGWRQRFEGWNQEILTASLLHTSSGEIWYINSNHNLPACLYDPTKDEWLKVNLSDLGGDNFDFSILETRDGAIWISSRGSLHVRKDGEWKVYHSPEYPIPGARSTLFQDSEGFVYLAEMSGINVRIDYARKLGQSFNNLHFEAQTADGDTLFISKDNEVVHIPSGRNIAEVHSAEETSIDTPVALIVHSNGDWILAGSHNEGAALSIWNGESWKPKYFPEFAPSFGHLSLMEHSNGNVWVGCAQLEEEFPQYEGGIVLLMPEASGNYTVDRLEPPVYSFRNWSLSETPSGEVVTSGNGLFINSLTDSQAIELPENMLYKWIDQVALDKEGVLWAAIWSMGVLKLDNGEWQGFSEEDGLDNPLTSFIFCLDGKYPVATTQNGHFRFDGDRWAPFMHTHSGLHRGSGEVKQATDGSIWINHTHVDWYYRGQRSEAYSEEKTRGFRTVQYIPDNIPPDTHWSLPPPELTRKDNIHFSWTGMDKWSRSEVDDLHYSYRIDSGPWSPFRPATEVTLSELKGGQHIVEIRARDSDFNMDPTPLKAEFSVIVPVWQQGWFVASLIAIVIFLIVLVILFIRQRVRHLLEIEQVKMRFFTHLSHEIKTPLSLILGPLERLQNEVSDSKHQHYLSLIKSNSQRLLLLINQLLDFRKFQLEKLEFKPEQADFIPFVRSCLAVFEGWSNEKNIDLRLDTKMEHLEFMFDQEMFHKIIDNLVNNAIKYTQPGGRVLLRVKEVMDPNAPRMGVLEIEDNGPGIPQSEQEAVFEPFFRSTSHTQFEEGSGIGLAFVKELVELLNGSIELKSPINGDAAEPGTCFTIKFPLHDAPPGTRPARKSISSKAPDAKDPSIEKPKDLVLLIEDNHDLREFISGELEGQFQVVTASNADEGIAKARELIPDVVISDVVMPGKDGFTASRELKKDSHTSHIPVILLTALRSEEHKRQAYESGADDFITKPVSGGILNLKLRNLIETQRHSRERVRDQFIDDHRITGISDADQKFLEKADSLLAENLANEQFDVAVLAEKMGFSRSAFYRKFNNLTDLSPANYIKTKRLHKAAIWLAEGTKTVTEIAYDVGFSDAGYFSRVFKDEYKCSPSEFRRKQVKS